MKESEFIIEKIDVFIRMAESQLAKEQSFIDAQRLVNRQEDLKNSYKEKEMQDLGPADLMGYFGGMLKNLQTDIPSDIDVIKRAIKIGKIFYSELHEAGLI